MKLRIDPEPDEAERQAIVAAIEAAAAAETPANDVWRVAALAEGVEEPVDP